MEGILTPFTPRRFDQSSSTTLSCTPVSSDSDTLSRDDSLSADVGLLDREFSSVSANLLNLSLLLLSLVRAV